MADISATVSFHNLTCEIRIMAFISPGQLLVPCLRGVLEELPCSFFLFHGIFIIEYRAFRTLKNGGGGLGWQIECLI